MSLKFKNLDRILGRTSVWTADNFLQILQEMMSY